MTKQIPVYQTDANGLFLHETVANEFPEQPGVFNVPFGAKLTAPPAVPEGMVAVAMGDSWSLAADHRAETLYRTDTAEQYQLDTAIEVNGAAVRYLGWGDVPAWLTAQTPPAPGSTWENGEWVAPPAGEDGADGSAIETDPASTGQ